MEIDLSPLSSTVNSLALQLAFILGIPFIAALVMGFLLNMLRLPKSIIKFVATVVFLIGLYLMVMNL